ncbi:serine/threonine-protein kinase [Mobilisporobacter senegalensis]|uniref:Serine/threonine-protein kinase n=1 Tax=Mobilisporobacter senegalensis TaxID=1329262 RepID=A0A3N1XLV9_9FIRM|nr:serine/threonine-protein kinase [Mobilisporobacter senegalensis]ROR25707.1 serine/threonine-protein kinase [Mobilisporobacter senegalensis]
MFDKYRIVKILGSGGSATVYLARHIKLESFRAIKCIRKDNPFYKDALREAYILKNLRHSNIPIIYDIEEDPRCSYIIEEYIEGESLKSFRLNHRFIQESIIINFSMQICELIQYLHKNEKPILYLDLKPENIMVSNHTLKLIDFGTAVYFKEPEKYTHTVGTKGYAAPEQYKKGKIDERCDVYGIGMLLFYLVTGRTFDWKINEFKNIDKVSNCSKKLKGIINKCLKYYPSHRYQSVLHLYNKLSEIRQNSLAANLLKSDKSLTVSLAGSQNRIGTTHTALLITSYTNKYVANSIYMEQNDHRVVKSIIQRYKNVKEKRHIYTLFDCNMTEVQELDKELLKNYQIIVKDFGVLTQENLIDFLDGNIRILILGAKEWELSNSERVLNELIEYKDITYLFNFVDGKVFREAVKSMDGKNCSRIPYVVNPLKITHNESISELIKEILGHSYFNRKKSKIFKFIYQRIRSYTVDQEKGLLGEEKPDINT